MRWETGSISRKVWVAMAAPGPGQQARLELDQGRFDPVEAVQREFRHQPLDNGGLERGFTGKHIVKAGGQQRSVDRIGHAGYGVLGS